MKLIGLILGLFVLSGCAIHGTETRMLVIPPQQETTTVTIQGVATCTDYFLVFTAQEKLNIVPTTGEVVIK